MNFKGFLILFIILNCSQLWAESFVKSEDDFYMHMRNHVNNVALLGEQVLSEAEKDPEIRKMLGVPPGEKISESLKALTRDFLEQHDASKLNTSKEFLAKYNQGRPIIGDLYKIYGKSFKDMSDSEKAIVVKIVNGTDDLEKAGFVKSHNLEPWKLSFLEKVEKLADFTERGKNPVTSEEMGRASFTESDGIRKQLSMVKNQEEAADLQRKLKLVEKLEANYGKSTTTYMSFKKEIDLFKKSLQASSIYLEYLDDYSLYQIQKDFKASKSSDLKSFLSNQYSDKLKKMIKSNSSLEGLMMIDLAKIEIDKSKGIKTNSRYNSMVEIMAGECAK